MAPRPHLAPPPIRRRRALDIGIATEEHPGSTHHPIFPVHAFMAREVSAPAPWVGDPGRPDLLVLGLRLHPATGALVGFRDYEPRPNHLRHLWQKTSPGVVWCAWTTPFPKVILHRGRDGWRFLFCFVTTIVANTGEDQTEARFPVHHCVPVFLGHDVVPRTRRSVTWRGLSLPLHDAVNAVPGMSSALSYAMHGMTHALGTITPRENVDGRPPVPLSTRLLPANHALASATLLPLQGQRLLGEGDTRDAPWTFTSARMRQLHEIASACFSGIGPNTLAPMPEPCNDVQPVARMVGMRRTLDL